MVQKALGLWWCDQDFVLRRRTSADRRNVNVVGALKTSRVWLALAWPPDWPKRGWPAPRPRNARSGSLPLNAPCAPPSPTWWCTVSVLKGCGTQVVWASRAARPKGCCCNCPRRVLPAVRVAPARPVPWNPCTRCLPLAWTKRWPVRVCALVWDETSRSMAKRRHARCSRSWLPPRFERS